MLMTNFLRNRKSVRDFKSKEIDIEIIREIESYLKELEREEGNGDIVLRFYIEGEKISNKLQGIGGYSGVMIESPHYIALELMNTQERSFIYGSYYMEKLITKLNELELGTCWISVPKVEKDEGRSIFGNLVGDIRYLLAVGYPKTKKIFENEVVSDRKGADEIVYIEEIGRKASLEELETRGLSDLFYYIRFAPSSRNIQPWRFLLERDKVTLLLMYENIEDLNLIDAGIVMYYFEALAQTIGIVDKWKLIDGEYKDKKINYKYIANFKL